MAHIKLEIEKRELTGNQCRKLRRDGILPAVIFGERDESIIVQLPTREFIKTYKESGKTNVIDLMIDGEKIPVIVQSIDVDPIHNTARHVDFREVNLKQKVTAQVPVIYEGEPAGVKGQGGVFTTYLDEIEVEALPDNIPSEIKINVEVIANIGDSMYVSDLPKDDKYEIITESTDALCGLIAQSTEEDFESDSELDLDEENGVEGEGEEGVEGETKTEETKEEETK